MKQNVAGCYSDGGQPVSNKDAAGALAQGHPKSGAPPIKWGMKDQQGEGTKAEEARDRRGG